MESIHPIWYLGAASILAAVPLMLGISTSFVKVSIVLNMLRSALGAQQVPGNFVIFSLSFALSAFIMSPVIKETTALLPKLTGEEFSELSAPDAVKLAGGLLDPLQEFLHTHSGERELTTLRELSAGVNRRPSTEEAIEGSAGQAATDNQADVSLPQVLLAFLLSELREAFSMGFVVLLPFLIIDLIVANILAGMGMFMVSPVMISFPLKVLLFVVSDGWIIVSKSLVLSYQ